MLEKYNSNYMFKIYFQLSKQNFLRNRDLNIFLKRKGVYVPFDKYLRFNDPFLNDPPRIPPGESI